MSDAPDRSTDRRPPAPIRWLDATARWCNRIAVAGAAGLCLTLGLLTAVLVAIQALSGWSRNVTDELKWHLFGAAFLLAMGWCLRTDGHVRVDLWYQRFGPRVRSLVDAVGLLAFAVPLCAIVVWYAVPQTLAMARAGEGSGQEGIPLFWPIYATIPLGFGLLGVQSLAQAARCLHAGLSVRDEDLR